MHPQRPRQPLPERLRKALPLDVQRVQVGVEVLPWAVHAFVAGLLLARGAIAGQLAQVRERGEQRDEFSLLDRIVVANRLAQIFLQILHLDAETLWW